MDLTGLTPKGEGKRKGEGEGVRGEGKARRKGRRGERPSFFATTFNPGFICSSFKGWICSRNPTSSVKHRKKLLFISKVRLFIF